MDKEIIDKGDFIMSDKTSISIAEGYEVFVNYGQEDFFDCMLRVISLMFAKQYDESHIR